MKKVNLLSLCMIFLFSIIGFSCEKNAEEKNYTEVEYRIDPMNEYFNSISYLDDSGKPVVITDPTQFASGFKKLSVSTKPFNARLDVEINNTSFSTKVYTLVILVNGELKAYKSVKAYPMSTQNAAVEYALQ